MAKSPEEVFGYISRLEGEELARLCKDKVVVEIGSFHGKSANYIAPVAKKLTCIDTFAANEGGQYQHEEPQTLTEFKKNTEEFDNIEIIVGRSENVHDRIPNASIDVLFIDGDHTYESVSNDLRNYLPKLKPDGVVCCHDYYSDWPGCVRAIHEGIGFPQRVVDVMVVHKIAGRTNGPDEVNWIPSNELLYNIGFIGRYLLGCGYEMGCGCTPIIKQDCIHVDISPQPGAVAVVGEELFVQWDASKLALWTHPRFQEQRDWIFSSHMVEDLENEKAMVDCLINWATLIKPGGYLVLLIPDMQGGRYPKVDDPAGNPSHRVNVGSQFFHSLIPHLEMWYELVQIDTIPHGVSCTMDVVFKKKAV